MSNTWIYQKNLALTCTDDLNLEEKKITVDLFLQDYKISRNLFDEDEKLERSVLISELDENLVDEDSFNIFLQKVKGVKRLVILNDRPKNDSKIYSDFSMQMLKAYIILFEKKGIDCFYTEDFL
jgi:hypothetical protein